MVRDHIACHNAVRRALRDSTLTPRAALGAVLDREAVATAAHDAEATFGQPVGSGRVTGAPRNVGSVVINGPHETELRRRQALDAYTPTLGTSPTVAFDTKHVGAGDSVLLRFVLDASGWQCDRFVEMALPHEQRGSSAVTQ